MFLSFFVLLLNIPSNVNLALWRLCASSRMANLRSVFHSFMAYATLRSVALLFGNHRFLSHCILEGYEKSRGAPHSTGLPTALS